MLTSNFHAIILVDLDCFYKLTYLMANSADPNQLVSLGFGGQGLRIS